MDALSQCVSGLVVRISGRIPTFHLDTMYDTDGPFVTQLTDESLRPTTGGHDFTLEMGNQKIQ